MSPVRIGISVIWGRFFFVFVLRFFVFSAPFFCLFHRRKITEAAFDFEVAFSMQIQERSEISTDD